jgi:phage FluMu protein Com
MQDIKCKNCNRLLGKATIMVAAIKCPRCKSIFEYHVYTNTLHVTNQFDTSSISGKINPESNSETILP